MSPCVSYLIGRRIVVRLVTGSRHLSGQARPARRPGFRASRRCLRAEGGPVAESDLITRDVSDGLRHANVDRLQVGARPRHEEATAPAKMVSHANHAGHAEECKEPRSVPSNVKGRSGEEHRMSKLGTNHRELEKRGGWAFGGTEGQCGSP